MVKRKTKEYYTVTLDGIPVRMLGGFLRETLGMSAEKIENSHFYAVGSGDFTYSDALDLDAYFAERHSATMHIKKIRFDREYREGTCLIYSDGSKAQLECDIEEADFDLKKLPELQEWLRTQVREWVAEYASISYTFDNGMLFEYGKGAAS
ncbi:MAG TPA: hypothetical protein DCG49_10105 [Ruminococcus sp.]|nr:hypothetical protein [Ruminococcus sp.]